MRTSVLLTSLLLAAPLFCQTTIPSALTKHWQTSGEFTLAVAKAMPAADYTFRPVPEEMTFAQVIVHIAAADLNACSIAGQVERPPIPPAIAQAMKKEKSVDKDQAVQFLSDTFDFCNRVVSGMTPDKLDAVVGPAARKMTGFEWLWAYFTHTAHHRGQAEVYLRLKGIKPPAYQF